MKLFFSSHITTIIIIFFCKLSNLIIAVNKKKWQFTFPPPDTKNCLWQHIFRHLKFIGYHLTWLKLFKFNATPLLVSSNPYNSCLEEMQGHFHLQHYTIAHCWACPMYRVATVTVFLSDWATFIKVARLPIMGCNFVFKDLLHQTLISNNGSWFTFPFMHIWWCQDDVIRFKGKSYFLDNSLFLKKWNHPSNSNFASSISMVISKKNSLVFEDNCFCFQVTASIWQIDLY